MKSREGDRRLRERDGTERFLMIRCLSHYTQKKGDGEKIGDYSWDFDRS
jgi:hypothetical protein